MSEREKARARRVRAARARAVAWETTAAWLEVLAIDAPGMSDPEVARAFRRVVLPAVQRSASKCRGRAEVFAWKAGRS